MQLHVRGNSTHVLDVEPFETIAVIKVITDCEKLLHILRLCFAFLRRSM